jgi:hypothetical protein
MLDISVVINWPRYLQPCSPLAKDLQDEQQSRIQIFFFYLFSYQIKSVTWKQRTNFESL